MKIKGLKEAFAHLRPFFFFAFHLQKKTNQQAKASKTPRNACVTRRYADACPKLWCETRIECETFLDEVPASRSVVTERSPNYGSTTPFLPVIGGSSWGGNITTLVSCHIWRI